MTTFIENAGAAIVSRKIVERTGNICQTATPRSTCRIPRT